MTQHSIEPIAYATPAPRFSRVAPAVWIALIGLGLIGLGGCFLIGVLAILHPHLSVGPGTTPVAMTPGIIFLLAVLYAAAFGCFGGAVVLVVKGIRVLFSMINANHGSHA